MVLRPLVYTTKLESFLTSKETQLSTFHFINVAFWLWSTVLGSNSLFWVIQTGMFVSALLRLSQWFQKAYQSQYTRIERKTKSKFAELFPLNSRPKTLISYNLNTQPPTIFSYHIPKWPKIQFRHRAIHSHWWWWRLSEEISSAFCSFQFANRWRMYSGLKSC